MALVALAASRREIYLMGIVPACPHTSSSGLCGSLALSSGHRGCSQRTAVMVTEISVPALSSGAWQMVGIRTCAWL